MKTITVREMKARWSEVEAQVRNGETFEVVNRGRPTVRIVPTAPRLCWFGMTTSPPLFPAPVGP
jgi:prevent-host-death family protein